MTQSNILFIGMGAHKESIKIAIAEKRGAITKCVNIHARKILIEPARKAQLRLTHRYRLMSRAKKNTNIIVVAIARELAAFMWAIFNELNIESRK